MFSKLNMAQYWHETRNTVIFNFSGRDMNQFTTLRGKKNAF